MLQDAKRAGVAEALYKNGPNWERFIDKVWAFQQIFGVSGLFGEIYGLGRISVIYSTKYSVSADKKHLR